MQRLGSGLNASLGWLVGLLLLVVTALLAWSEYATWHSEVARVEAETEHLARALGQHADDTLDLASVALAGVVEQMENGATTAVDLGNVLQSMRSAVDASPRLSELAIAGANGRLLASTASGPLDATDLLGQAYFRHHQFSSSQATRLWPPFRRGPTGEWIIPITRRFNTEDGQFGGLAIASVSAKYFSDYYEAFRTGQDGSIVLVSGDKVILVRSPVNDAILATRLAPGSDFVRQLNRADAGSYHYVSPVDGVKRIGGFYRSGRSQLTILAAVSEAESFAKYVAGAKLRGSVSLLVVLGTALLSVQLLRQTRRRQASERELARREAEFRLLTEYSSDLVERLDRQGTRRYVSPAAVHILGRPAAELVGTRAYDSIHHDDLPSVLLAVRRLEEGATSETISFRSCHADGNELWLESTLSVVPQGTLDGAGVVAVTRDITHRKRLEQQLAVLASRDALTGLANRRHWDERTALEVARAMRERQPLSILMIDVDHFKGFNDSYGHPAGDVALRDIAKTIMYQVQRPADLVARLGGEEFGVMLPNTDSAGAFALAQRLIESVNTQAIPHHLNQPWAVVTISIGIATAVPGGPADWSIDSLMEEADTALYRAKSTGRNKTVLAAEQRAARRQRPQAAQAEKAPQSLG